MSFLKEWLRFHTVIHFFNNKFVHLSKKIFCRLINFFVYIIWRCFNKSRTFFMKHSFFYIKNILFLNVSSFEVHTLRPTFHKCVDFLQIWKIVYVPKAKVCLSHKFLIGAGADAAIPFFQIWEQETVTGG